MACLVTIVNRESKESGLPYFTPFSKTITSLKNGRPEPFLKYFMKITRRFRSHIFKYERDAHNSMASLLFLAESLFKDLNSDKEIILGGRPNFSFRTENRVIIFEFKESKTSERLRAAAQEGLAQIRGKQYYATFLAKHPGIKFVDSVSVSFNGQKCYMIHDPFTYSDETLISGLKVEQITIHSIKRGRVEEGQGPVESRDGAAAPAPKAPRVGSGGRGVAGASGGS